MALGSHTRCCSCRRSGRQAQRHLSEGEGFETSLGTSGSSSSASGQYSLSTHGLRSSSRVLQGWYAGPARCGKERAGGGGSCRSGCRSGCSSCRGACSELASSSRGSKYDRGCSSRGCRSLASSSRGSSGCSSCCLLATSRDSIAYNTLLGCSWQVRCDRPRRDGPAEHGWHRGQVGSVLQGLDGRHNAVQHSHCEQQFESFMGDEESDRVGWDERHYVHHHG
mmetsp:Transcript_40019/g.74358  ORF Transcript_40019/g.74358 Transcript_40019/m.74358 type:complete len:223 (-) Transcript_40019:547-1215(-)